MTQKLKIIIADDHAILRVGLSTLLNTFDDFSVVDEAENGMATLRKVQKHNPDIVILDLMMPDMDGVEVTGRLVKMNPNTRILILTTFGTSDGISRALRAGALGAILKNAEIEELTTAIRTVAGGNRYVSRELKRIMTEDPPVQELTPRQLQILDSLVRGLTSVDIATQLDISADMVREHTSALFKRLGAANRAEAVAIALRKHLLKV